MLVRAGSCVACAEGLSERIPKAAILDYQAVCTAPTNFVIGNTIDIQPMIDSAFEDIGVRFCHRHQVLPGFG